MDYYTALSKAADESGKTMSGISTELGHNSSYIAAAKQRGSMPLVTNAAAMLNACGYALCAVPLDGLPPNALVIDAPKPDHDAQARALERKKHQLEAELKRVTDALNQ